MVARASGRPFGALGRIGIVAGFHVAVILLVANSLGFHPIKLADPIIGEILEQPTQPPETPPVVDPTLQRQQDVVVPIPENPPIDREIETSIVAQPMDPDRPIIDVTPPPPTATIIGVQSDPRYPLTQPPYPPDAIRAGNAGNAIVEIYVLPNGRIGEARIVKSSGFESLDRATLNEARRNWRMKPATRDGVPYPEWHKLSVVFRLENR